MILFCLTLNKKQQNRLLYLFVLKYYYIFQNVWPFSINSVIQNRDASPRCDPVQTCHDPFAGRDPSVEKRCYIQSKGAANKKRLGTTALGAKIGLKYI